MSTVDLAPPLATSAEMPAPPSRRELVTMFAGLMLALALASLDQNIVGPALPRIVIDLGGLTHLTWVVTAFLLTSTASTPLYGKLSDMYGRKPLFFVAIGIFLGGSVLCGLAQSMLQLILFRALQGLGAGGLLILAQTTVGDLISPRERGRYQGLFGAVFAACSVAGPLLGGWLTDALSWRWIFYVNLPIGAAALLIIACALRPHRFQVRHSIDFTGAALLTAATFSLLLFLSWGGSTYPWNSGVERGLAMAALVLTALLLFWERRAHEPILALHLFRLRIVTIAVLVVGLTSAAIFGSIVFLPLYFQIVLGVSPTRAGLMLAPIMGGVIVGAVGGGRVVTWTGRYKPLPVGGLGVAGLIFLTLANSTEHRGSLYVLEPALFILGCGLGLVMPTLTVALQNAVERVDLGSATALAAFIRSLGGAFGVALAGALVSAELHRRLPSALLGLNATSSAPGAQGLRAFSQLGTADHLRLSEAYRHAIGLTYYCGAGIAAVAFTLALFMPEKPLRSTG